MTYLVSLHNLWRRIVGAIVKPQYLLVPHQQTNSLIMRLIVLVPLVTSVDSVEVPWFSGPVLVLPIVGGWIR